LDFGKHRGERNRRAALTGGTALLARTVQVGTSLVTFPLTIHYLGDERFGLWMTISSVLAMANFADFGIGNGVLNTVADANGKNDFERIRAAISSGFAVLGAVGIFLMAIFVSTFGWLSWADILRVTSVQARAEAGPALLVFACCFALNIPLDLVQRAQLGLQEGFRMNLWQVCGTLGGLAGVIVGVRLHAGLPVLVAALAGAPVAATALNAIQFFGFSRPELFPRRRYISREAISRIVTFGTLFFVLQIVASVSFSGDNFIIARTLGASSVPEYSIPQRMFAIISLMVGMLVAPLWPAYGEAISRGDLDWVRRTLGRSLLLVLASALAASSVLLLIAHRVLAWWIGPSFSPPFLLLLGLALWTVVDCCGTTLAMFLNGAGMLRVQIAFGSLFAIACLLLKVYLSRRFGVAAVPWATVLTYVSLLTVPYSISTIRALKNLKRVPNEILIATPVIEE
jgi:O-antigen/teichoic acid export membrane protein